MSGLESLLGTTVIGAGGVEVPVSSFKGKVVGLYFSAHWCGPCRAFTPKLIEYYKAHAESKNFEIVFLSSDRSESEFGSYFDSMPWKAAPFGSDIKEKLSSKFKVRGIPTFVWVDADGETITTDGRAEVMGDPTASGFPYKPVPIADLLTDSTAITAGTGDDTTIGELRKTNDYIGLYFSAHWCGPCRAFTPQLSKFYKDNAAGKKFDIVFLSSDENSASFDSYFRGMPWKALPFAQRELKEKMSKACNVEGIPTFVLLETKTMTVSCADARSRVSATPDEFPWLPKPVEPLGVGLGKVNDVKMLIMFTDKLTSAESEDAAKAAMQPAAERYFNARESGKEEEGGDIHFVYAAEEDDSAERVREFVGVGDDSEGDDAVRMILLNIPSGVKYVWGGTGVPSADDVTVFLTSIEADAVAPMGIRDKVKAL